MFQFLIRHRVKFTNGKAYVEIKYNFLSAFKRVLCDAGYIFWRKCVLAADDRLAIPGLQH